LEGLLAQQTDRRYEVIVVDNNPRSGKNEPVATTAGVRYVQEPFSGASTGRNTGVGVAGGDVVVFADEDTYAPPHWLEALLAPFADPNIAAVTGAVHALSLETRAEQLFEARGGLTQSRERIVFDDVWFSDVLKRTARLYLIGVTANLAVRKSAFNDPRVAGFDPMLGAGAPGQCSEELYLFYRLLKAGYRIQFEPSAWLKHNHRTEMKALRRQFSSYMFGTSFMALLFTIREKERGFVWHQISTITVWRYKQLWEIVQAWIRRESAMPLSMWLSEVFAYFRGVWAFPGIYRKYGKLYEQRRLASQKAQSSAAQPHSNL
jgi:O-antigen biosynthesis protein